MKKLIIGLLAAACGIQAAFAQKGIDKDSMKEARDEARQQQTQLKKQAAAANVQALASPTPNPFNDTDSFGQNVLFLGSMYAGTVYVYHSCDPQVLLDEQGVVLAADDHCLVKPMGGSTGVPGASTVSVFDDVWQVTIPKNTVQNVIYPMLNNGVLWFNDGTSGPGSYSYSPQVTIVSDALNDPAAVDPATGLPMNGSYTTSLAGSVAKFMPSLVGGEFENTNYASVAGRGFSRTYFRALGLPNNVINKLFKKEITLKFGIRVRVSGAIEYGQFFYQFRLLGQ